MKFVSTSLFHIHLFITTDMKKKSNSTTASLNNRERVKGDTRMKTGVIKDREGVEMI